jgi:hypothetical protein
VGRLGVCVQREGKSHEHEHQHPSGIGNQLLLNSAPDGSRIRVRHLHRCELPSIPLAPFPCALVSPVVKALDVSRDLVKAGKRLTEVHVQLEQQPEYKLTWGAEIVCVVHGSRDLAAFLPREKL